MCNFGQVMIINFDIKWECYSLKLLTKTGKMEKAPSHTLINNVFRLWLPDLFITKAVQLKSFICFIWLLLRPDHDSL